jgi:hypothetical protein
VDIHWVTKRIKDGKLKASRRHTDREKGDYSLISDRAVVQFICENPYEVDLRKVDRLWFMDLMVAALKEAI